MRRKVRGSLVIAVVACACSSTRTQAVDGVGAPHGPDFANGIRLHARVIGADDAALLVGWHDTGPEDVDCTFETAEDGVIRCIPTGSNVLSADAFYLDAKCSVPAVFGNASGKLIVERDACRRVLSIWHLNPAPPRMVDIWLKLGDGRCDAQGSTGMWSTPADRLAPSAFVGARQARVDTSDRLARTTLEADDGSSQAYKLLDKTRNEACSPAAPLQTGRSDRCFPENFAISIGLFVDAACTAPLLCPQAVGCGPPPNAGLEPDGTFVELGAAATSGFSGDSDDCHSDSVERQDCSAPGAVLPVDSFPALGSRNEGNGRIQLRALTDPVSSSRLVGWDFFDSVRGEECAPDVAADSVTRCLPTQQSGALVPGAYFADGSCTRALVASPVDVMPPRYTFASTGSPMSPIHVFAIGQRFTGSVFTIPETPEMTPGACSAATPPSDLAFYEFSEVDPASFAPLVVSTR